MGTIQKDPSSDVYNTMTATGGSTAAEVLTSLDRNPDTPDVTTFVSPTVSAQEVIVHTDNFIKSSVSSVNEVTVNVYIDRPANSTIEIRLLLGAVQKATTTDATGGSPGSAGWITATWVSGDLSVADLSDLRIQVIATYSGTAPKIYAAHLTIDTTETALTFTAPSNTHVAATPSAWRPRLSPGYFWVRGT